MNSVEKRLTDSGSIRTFNKVLGFSIIVFFADGVCPEAPGSQASDYRLYELLVDTAPFLVFLGPPEPFHLVCRRTLEDTRSVLHRFSKTDVVHDCGGQAHFPSLKIKPHRGQRQEGRFAAWKTSSLKLVLMWRDPVSNALHSCRGGDPFG